MRLALVVLLAFSTSIAAAAPYPPYEEPYASWDQLGRVHTKLQLALVGGGAASMVAGAGLCATSRYDHALQVAGGVTLAFGVADLAAGIAGTLAARNEATKIRTEAQTVPFAQGREDLLSRSSNASTTFAVNLGLDAGFVFAGLVAVGASRAGIDHNDRWLAGGLAAVVQGVFAAAIDGIGTAASSRAHRRALAARSQAQ